MKNPMIAVALVFAFVCSPCVKADDQREAEIEGNFDTGISVAIPATTMGMFYALDKASFVGSATKLSGIQPTLVLLAFHAGFATGSLINYVDLKYYDGAGRAKLVDLMEKSHDLGEAAGSRLVDQMERAGLVAGHYKKALEELREPAQVSATRPSLSENRKAE